MLTKTELFIKHIQENARINQESNSRKYYDFIPNSVKSRRRKFFEERDKQKNKSSAYAVIMNVMTRAEKSKKKLVFLFSRVQ